MMTARDWSDLNGDGLPDMVSSDGMVLVSLYITKRSEAVLQWGKRKNIKKLMINGELVIE